MDGLIDEHEFLAGVARLGLDWGRDSLDLDATQQVGCVCVCVCVCEW